MPATTTFLGMYVDTNNASTYTFSNVPLGNPSSDRYIVAGIHARNAGNNNVSLNTCVIAGTQATIDASYSYNGSDTNYSGVAKANIPTGTTGNITITFGGSITAVRCGLALRDVKGIDPTPYATTSQSSTATGSLTTRTISCLGGGLVFGVAGCAGNAPPSASWTGLTEVTDTLVEGAMVMTDAYFAPVSTTNIVFTTSFVPGSPFGEANSIAVAYSPTTTTGSTTTGIDNGEFMLFFIN